MSSISTRVAQTQRHSPPAPGVPAVASTAPPSPAPRTLAADPLPAAALAPGLPLEVEPPQACTGISPRTWAVLIPVALGLWLIVIGVAWLLLGVLAP